MISPEQRLQYLEAMGVQVWLERSNLATKDTLTDISSFDLDGVHSVAENCQLCDLAQTRKQVVFGLGPQQAQWFVIGDAPSEFEGASASLLNDMLLAIGESRQSSYLTTSVKCQSENGGLTVEHLQYCRVYLLRQIELVQPSIVLVTGEQTAQSLLCSSSTLSELRGQVHHLEPLGITVIATHHPRELLVRPELKREAWDDLQLARKQLQQ
ncbi:MAG: hypothetical protein A6F71_08755 [Cycloclasticus sp. symbiont of Poecilosclerida sp. M]|nr:MAG: hypothetical protein A6F71_08755 [Cycloclasticus sp. symbiont of Poecilosclerida sp. M]